ncbi:MAG: DUF3341 domain-containing protein [Acidobacteria bacterium]|nr:DUF3341 domain-containing protein [Acidobacteriota bacterium]
MSNLFCIAAEFDDEHKLLEACNKTRQAGYKNIDAYTPFAVHGIREALGQPATKMPWAVFAGGLLGLSVGFGLCYWVSVLELPYNVGGRPLNSWVSFIPVTFECTILLSAFTAVFGMFGLNGLPLPNHPMFNLPSFLRASQDRFFLVVESDDPKFEPSKVSAFLETLNPLEVREVEDE